MSRKSGKGMDLIPKWRPINDSFVCMLISPLCLVHMYQKQKNFVVKMRLRGLINVQTKDRARNNGRSTDNVRTDCGFDRSNFRLAGHVDRSKFNSIENEINLRFLLFSCFSRYLSSRCVLRNVDVKFWRHVTRAVVYNSRIETDIGIPHFL